MAKQVQEQCGRGRPSVYETLTWKQRGRTPITTPEADSRAETPQTETQEMRKVRKQKLTLSPDAWNILDLTQHMCEDSCIFETPFPTPQKDMSTRMDSWKAAARKCDIKGEVPEMDEDIDQYVGVPFWIGGYS